MLQSIKSERCKQLKRFISLLLSLLLFAQHSCHHLLLFWPFIAVVQMVRGLAGHWSTIKMVSEDNNNNNNNNSNSNNKDNAFTCVVFAFLAWDILILFLALISLIFFVNHNSRAAKLCNYYGWFHPTTVCPRGEKLFGCCGILTGVSKHHKPKFHPFDWGSGVCKLNWRWICPLVS